MSQYADVAEWAILLPDGSELPLTPSEGVTVEMVEGAGMPPVSNVMTPYALLDGASWQRAIAQPRVVTMVLRAVGGCQRGLARVRRALIAAVSPHRADQPLTLRHYGPDDVRDLAVHYDAGLEGGGVVGWSEQLGLRLLAPDPYWYGDDQMAALTPYETLAVSAIVERTPDGWNNMAGGLFAPSFLEVLAIKTMADGSLLVGGYFHQDANSNSVPYLARWDGVSWQPFTADAPNDRVYSIVQDAMGNVYIAGSFTKLGAMNVGSIAKWDGTSWDDLAGGMDTGVRCLAMGPDNQLYAAGAFTSAGGQSCSRIARWDGYEWHPLGDGLPSYVHALTMGYDGYLYAGGQFNKSQGAVGDRVAYWDGSAWHDMPPGLSDIPYALLAAPNGDVYVGGEFTSPGAAVARWDGQAWHALGAGLTRPGNVAIARVLGLGPDGYVYAGGTFTHTGDSPLPQRVALWNGNAWLPVDLRLPIDPFVSSMETVGDRFYVGFTTGGNALVGALTEVDNIGSAEVGALISVTATGPFVTLQSITNETTAQRMWFNIPLLEGETVTVDTRPGTTGIYSDYRGTNLGANPLSGSQLASFRLRPGPNTIGLYCPYSAGGSATASIRYRPAYWSTD